LTLDAEDIERIAVRVVELLHETPEPGTTADEQGVRFVDAATLARLLGVERDWVYAHAADLGAVRLGGQRGRLRFDLQALDGVLDAARAPIRTPPTQRSQARPSRTAKSCPSSGRRHPLQRSSRAGLGPVELLPVRLESTGTHKVAGRRANAPGPTPGGVFPVQDQRTTGGAD